MPEPEPATAATTAPAPATPGSAAAGPGHAHAHAWTAMRFELVDGHPRVVETCATCGLVRRYRAFERTWDGLPSQR